MTERAHRRRLAGASASALGWALALTLGYAAVEFGGGLWAGSLALVSDAGHMLSDAFALGLAAFASWLGRRPASRRHSYGLARAEVIAALLNGLLMLGVIVMIVGEAVQRLRNPLPVAPIAVIVIACGGLAINGAIAWTLSRGEPTLNVRAALIHVTGDLIGSFAAVVAGAVIYATGWLPIDPILSLVIAALILFSTLNLLRDTMHVLMEGVPSAIDLEAVGNALARLDGVAGVHDLHIWNIASGRVALSAHVVVEDLAQWPRTLERAQRLLLHEFFIDHVTLQPELAAGGAALRRATVTIFRKKP